MSSLDEAMMTYLAQHPALTNLVSDRIYPEMLPETDDQAGEQVTLPAIVYNEIDTSFTNVEQSVDWVDSDTGTEMVRYQFDVYDSDRIRAKEVDTVLRQLLSGFRGFWPPFRIHGSFRVNRLINPVPEPELTRVSSDYQILFSC